MKRWAVSIALCLTLAAASPAGAVLGGDDSQPLPSPTFEQAMCGICNVASYSPACWICTVMMMFDAVGGWD